MSFASDKTNAINVLSSYDCEVADVASRMLVVYADLFKTFIYLVKYFQQYPTLMARYLTSWDDSQLQSNGIFFNKEDVGVTTAKVIANSNYDLVTVTVPANSAIAEIVIIGTSIVGKLALTKDPAGLYLGMVNVQGGARVKIIDIQNNLEVKELLVGGGNGLASTVNVVTTNNYRIGKITTDNGGFFGEYSCLDPTSVCASDVSGMAINKVTTNSLLLNWVAASESVRTIVQYRQSNTMSWLDAAKDNKDGVSGNYATDGSVGYGFRGLQSDTYYDFRIINVCLNGILSAGVQFSGKTNGTGSGNGGGGNILIDGQFQFEATDGQITWSPPGSPNPLIGAKGVDVEVEGQGKFLGTDPDEVDPDYIIGQLTFNTPLLGVPTLERGQRVKVNIYR